VLTAFMLLALGLWFALGWWRRRDLPESRWFLRGAAASGAVSLISLECGWVVTEVGRQPWTVQGLLLTRDAVTGVDVNLWWVLALILVIYTAVGIATVVVLRSMRRRWAAGEDPGVPYGPEAPLEAALPETVLR
jgi:cytochrome d ubiquinol oxidase subunit I